MRTMSHVIACVGLFGLRLSGSSLRVAVPAGVTQMILALIVVIWIVDHVRSGLRASDVVFVVPFVIGVIVTRLATAHEVRKAMRVGVDRDESGCENAMESQRRGCEEGVDRSVADRLGMYEKWERTGWLWWMIEPSPFSGPLFGKDSAGARGF